MTVKFCNYNSFGKCHSEVKILSSRTLSLYCKIFIKLILNLVKKVKKLLWRLWRNFCKKIGMMICIVWKWWKFTLPLFWQAIFLPKLIWRNVSFVESKFLTFPHCVSLSQSFFSWNQLHTFIVTSLVKKKSYFHEIFVKRNMRVCSKHTVLKLRKFTLTPQC